MHCERKRVGLSVPTRPIHARPAQLRVALERTWSDELARLVKLGVEVECRLDRLVEEDFGEDVAAFVSAGRRAHIDEDDVGRRPAGSALLNVAGDGGRIGTEDGALEVGRDVGAVFGVELAAEVDGLGLLDAASRPGVKASVAARLPRTRGGAGKASGSRVRRGGEPGGGGGKSARFEVTVDLPVRCPEHGRELSGWSRRRTGSGESRRETRDTA